MEVVTGGHRGIGREVKSGMQLLGLHCCQGWKQGVVTFPLAILATKLVGGIATSTSSLRMLKSSNHGSLLICNHKFVIKEREVWGYLQRYLWVPSFPGGWHWQVFKTSFCPWQQHNP